MPCFTQHVWSPIERIRSAYSQLYVRHQNERRQSDFTSSKSITFFYSNLRSVKSRRILASGYMKEKLRSSTHSPEQRIMKEVHISPIKGQWQGTTLSSSVLLFNFFLFNYITNFKFLLQFLFKLNIMQCQKKFNARDILWQGKIFPKSTLFKYSVLTQ